MCRCPQFASVSNPNLSLHGARCFICPRVFQLLTAGIRTLQRLRAPPVDRVADMGVRLAHARAKDPRWLTTLSGSPPPPFDDGLDLPWCALCLRRDNDEEDGESLTLRDTKACASGTHAFCSSCRDVCGGELLREDKRCPLCRLTNSNGLNAFNSIVRESESLKLPKPSPAYAGTAAADAPGHRQRRGPMRNHHGHRGGQV